MNAEKFKTWLSAKGAIVLQPTNEWEVVRFKTDNGVSVIYKNKTGKLTFTGESETAFHKYRNGLGWKTVSRKRQNIRAQLGRLAARDGKKCFFCGRKYNNIERYKIEHILSFAHGGTDNENNLCLTCDDCQSELGTLPITKKMLIRDKKDVLVPHIEYKPTPKGINYFHKLFKGKQP